MSSRSAKLCAGLLVTALIGPASALAAPLGWWQPRAQVSMFAPVGRGTLTPAAARAAVGSGRASRASLQWAPPHLVNPVALYLSQAGDPVHLSLAVTRDYILRLPVNGLRGTLWIDGGHNVVVIGGEITVPATADQSDNGRDNTDTALYIKGSTGTVHVEGVLIRADPATMFDAIDVNAPLATVQLENIRAEHVWGSQTSEHADVVQTWGGAKNLEIDRLTADGDYQGLTIGPDLGRLGSAEISRVDLTDAARPPSLKAGTVGGGTMIWLTAGTGSCDSSPVRLSSVFVHNETSRIASGGTVWPNVGGPLACAGVASGDQVSWPDLPVDGAVSLGSPPQGEFVPAGVAGNTYRSPGYASGTGADVGPGSGGRNAQ